MSAWVTISSDTTGGYCPRCGYSLVNDLCPRPAMTVTVYRPNYFSEEEDAEPEPHRALIVDNWRALLDRASALPSLKWCRLRPEVRAPPEAICQRKRAYPGVGNDRRRARPPLTHRHKRCPAITD